MLGIGLLGAFVVGVIVAILGATLAGVSTAGLNDSATLGQLPELLGRGWLAIVEEGALGFAIATLARSQLAGVGAGIAVYFGEQFATIFLPDIVKYLPFNAASAVVAVSGRGGFREMATAHSSRAWTPMRAHRRGRVADRGPHRHDAIHRASRDLRLGVRAGQAFICRPSRQAPDHPAINRQDHPVQVRRGRREQERDDPSKLVRVAITTERDPSPRLVLDGLDARARLRCPGGVETADSLGVESPGRDPVDPDGGDLPDQALDQADQSRAQHVRGDESGNRLANR